MMIVVRRRVKVRPLVSHSFHVIQNTRVVRKIRFPRSCSREKKKMVHRMQKCIDLNGDYVEK
jgi:hypothetical protein